jgi:hypothetical protein
MIKQRNQHGVERLTDSIAYRIDASTRSHIEEIAESENVGLCEAARLVMQAGIEALNKVKAGA